MTDTDYAFGDIDVDTGEAFVFIGDAHQAMTVSVDHAEHLLNALPGAIRSAKRAKAKGFPTPESDPEKLLEHCFRKLQVTPEELEGRSKREPLCAKRQVIMALLYERTSLSYPAIGELFNKHHATVMHAHRRVQLLRQFNGANAETDVERTVAAYWKQVA